MKRAWAWWPKLLALKAFKLWGECSIDSLECARSRAKRNHSKLQQHVLLTDARDGHKPKRTNISFLDIMIKFKKWTYSEERRLSFVCWIWENSPGRARDWQLWLLLQQIASKHSFNRHSFEKQTDIEVFKCSTKKTWSHQGRPAWLLFHREGELSMLLEIQSSFGSLTSSRICWRAATNRCRKHDCRRLIRCMHSFI